MGPPYCVKPGQTAYNKKLVEDLTEPNKTPWLSGDRDAHVSASSVVSNCFNQMLLPQDQTTPFANIGLFHFMRAILIDTKLADAPVLKGAYGDGKPLPERIFPLAATYVSVANFSEVYQLTGRTTCRSKLL